MKESNYLARVLAIICVSFFVQFLYAQKGYTYKCIEITNYGEPWELEDKTYYIEFSDNGLTKWTLVEGEWKYPEWFDFEGRHDNGICYSRKNYILKGSSVHCVDHFEFSTDLSILRRYYRCPESPYRFDYVFKRVK